MWLTTSASPSRWPASISRTAPARWWARWPANAPAPRGTAHTAAVRSSTPRKSSTRRTPSDWICRASRLSSAPRWSDRNSTCGRIGTLRTLAARSRKLEGLVMEGGTAGIASIVGQGWHGPVARARRRAGNCGRRAAGYVARLPLARHGGRQRLLPRVLPPVVARSGRAARAGRARPCAGLGAGRAAASLRPALPASVLPYRRCWPGRDCRGSALPLLRLPPEDEDSKTSKIAWLAPSGMCALGATLHGARADCRRRSGAVCRYGCGRDVGGSSASPGRGAAASERATARWLRSAGSWFPNQSRRAASCTASTAWSCSARSRSWSCRPATCTKRGSKPATPSGRSSCARRTSR